MTVAEHVAAVEKAYVNEVWRPRAEAAAAKALTGLGAARVVNLLVAIPSKRQYRPAMGRAEQAATTDRRLIRLMARDVNVRDAVAIVRPWAARLTEFAHRRQVEEYADAVLVQAIAYDAATDARIRVRVTRGELESARGLLIVGRPLRSLLGAAVGRLAGRLRAIPAEIAARVKRYKTSLEPAIRAACNGALARFARECSMLLLDYWYGAVQHAWSRPLAVRGVKR